MRRNVMRGLALPCTGLTLLGLWACTTVNVPAPAPGGGGGGGGAATPPPATAAPTATAAPPTAAPTVAPTAGVTQKPYHFDSNTSGTGEIGTVRLELGRRTFKATHSGSSNFILYVTSTVPESGPEVAFNEIGAGSWTWTYQVQQAGDYTLDLKEADGEWTIDIN